MPVDSKHPDYCKVEKDWKQIEDCIAGQRKIKEEGPKYLPQPNATDDSLENQERYRAYKKRAVFHNMTARTVDNMVGQCFAIDPVPTLPDEMLPWLDDIDGGGVSATQQSKQALGYVVAYSRCGIWVDYPKTAGVVSKADAEEKGVRPRILLFKARDVINWRVAQVGAQSKLSLVVIRERYIKKDDGFEAEFADQYRVLRLVDGKTYTQEIQRQGAEKWEIVERSTPTDGAGLPFDYIPFTFISPAANDPAVEKPLMLDISNINLAHYRNSADYEEITYMVGQPTPWIAGLDDKWINNHMKGGIHLGSRVCIALPKDASAGMLEVNPETLAKEAMDQKQELAAELGAKLVEKSEVQQTATEAGINEASETSILAACCKNTSAAYAWALNVCAQYADIKVAEPDKDVLFELNTDFAVARMAPDAISAVVAAYQAQLITFEEARDKLKTGGWAYLDDDDAKDQLEEQADADFEKAQQELKSQTDEQMRLQQAKGAPTPAPAS